MNDADQLELGDFGGVSSEQWTDLYERACLARHRAWAPYSNFPVGASLLTPSGEVWTGANVENATFGATICAERVAVGAAVTAGEMDYRGLCIVTDQSPPAPPCGICRQVLAEFEEALPILLANPKGETEFVELDALFPRPFNELPGNL